MTSSVPLSTAQVKDLASCSLFLYFGIYLPIFTGTSLSSREDYCNRVPYDGIDKSGKNQTSLLLMASGNKLIPKIAHGKTHIYLDDGVWSTFRYERKAVVRAAVKLEREGIVSIGHLVRLTEQDLNAYAFLTPQVVSDMRSRLELVGLGFGMIIPRRRQLPRWYLGLNS